LVDDDRRALRPHSETAFIVADWVRKREIQGLFKLLVLRSGQTHANVKAGLRVWHGWSLLLARGRCDHADRRVAFALVRRALRRSTASATWRNPRVGPSCGPSPFGSCGSELRHDESAGGGLVGLRRIGTLVGVRA
jgi:hypothetical protein